MKSHDYWLYVFRYYAESEGCFGVYAIPPEYQAKFEAFLEELKTGGITENIELFWSTCFQTVNLTTNWYNENTGQWDFRWNHWIQELNTQKTDLPYTLTDPEGFPQKADYTDIFILKELEKDATTTLKSIAENLDTSLQSIKYHFDKHVVDRRLLESYQVNSFPFNREKSDFVVFLFTFPNKENLAKFANSLSDKPFAKTIGKVHGTFGLITQLYLPRKEFRLFVDALSTLINTGFIKSYRYIIQDLRFLSRQTIPYKLFIEDKWQYEQEKYLKELTSLLQTNKLIPDVSKVDTYELSAKI
jgi:DNA-binding Lrp family transcriptional regulator